MNAPARREMVQDLEQFRSEVRQWLEDNCPASQRQPITPEEQYYGGRNAEFPSEDAKIWFERMRDKGWICPEWPTEYGGGGLSPQEAKIIKEEMKALRARTPLYSIGIWMLGPALLEFGNEAQKQQHIRAIINGEARWAQGYSEPDPVQTWPVSNARLKTRVIISWSMAARYGRPPQTSATGSSAWCAPIPMQKNRKVSAFYLLTWTTRASAPRRSH